MNTVFIYALNEPCSGPDPTAGRTRYVGKAADPYERYEAHLNENKRERSHKANWIRSLLKVGKTPILEILDEVPETEWQFWECEWIRLYLALGFRLTNGTAGGDGGQQTEAVRKKMSDSHSGKQLSALHRKRQSEGKIGNKGAVGNKNHLGHKHSEATKLIIGLAGIGRPTSEKQKRIASLTHLGKPKSAETRANMVEAQKLRRAKEKGQA